MGKVWWNDHCTGPQKVKLYNYLGFGHVSSHFVSMCFLRFVRNRIWIAASRRHQTISKQLRNTFNSFEWSTNIHRHGDYFSLYHLKSGYGLLCLCTFHKYTHSHSHTYTTESIWRHVSKIITTPIEWYECLLELMNVWMYFFVLFCAVWEIKMSLSNIFLGCLWILWRKNGVFCLKNG